MFELSLAGSMIFGLIVANHIVGAAMAVLRLLPTEAVTSAGASQHQLSLGRPVFDVGGMGAVNEYSCPGLES